MVTKFISSPLNTIIETAIIKGIKFSEMALSLEMDDIELTDFLMGITPINDNIANGLYKLFGVDKKFWVNRQKNYDKKVVDSTFEIINSKLPPSKLSKKAKKYKMRQKNNGYSGKECICAEDGFLAGSQFAIEQLIKIK